MKWLIIGNGFLGKTIFESIDKNKNEVQISDYKNEGIDVTDNSSIQEYFQKFLPDITINCAAISNVDNIENNPNAGLEVNAYGSQKIALACKKYNSKLIHISTDSVFDGKKGMYTEIDSVHPINEYAKTKCLAEDFIKESLKNHVIIRTNFYGIDPSRNNLLNWIITKLENQETIRGFTDVIFNPLEIHNLAEMIIEIGKLDFIGIIHLASDEVFSKFEFCKKVSKYLGYNEKLVIKGKSNHSKLIAKRPTNTSLDNSLSKKIIKTNQINLKSFCIELRTKL